MEKIKEQSFITGRVRIITQDVTTGAIKRTTEWFQNIIVLSLNHGRNLIAQRLASQNTFTLNVTHADMGRGHPAPVAPSVAVGVAGVLTGAYTYRITFVSADGETEGGTISAVVNPSSQQVNLSAIPLGASGIIARRIYRTISGGGGIHRLVTTINDNTTTTHTDNLADGSLGANVPTASTARATAPANSDTQLQTAIARGAVAGQSINNNIVTLRFFFSDATLPNGVYSEFGAFIDGGAGINTGQLFNRALFGIVYNKATGEDTTIEVEFTIN